jgi:hypothetical protein
VFRCSFSSGIVAQVQTIRGLPRKKGGCAHEAHNSGSHGGVTPGGDDGSRRSGYGAAGEEGRDKTEEKTDANKDKDKDKDLPKSGGLPINASLLGLGAGALLVGGGLFAVRIARQDRR